MPMIEISDEDLAFLRELTHEIKTQDTVCTAPPLYYVVRTWRDYAGPSGYGDRDVLVDMQGDPSTFSTEAEARAAMKEWGCEPEEIEERVAALEHFSMHEVSQHENVFFTRKGYEEHMRLNGHNYRPPSNKDVGPYVMHAFRNPEIKTLLEIVQRLGAPPCP